MLWFLKLVVTLNKKRKIIGEDMNNYCRQKGERPGVKSGVWQGRKREQYKKTFKRERFCSGLWLMEVPSFLFPVQRNILLACLCVSNLTSHIIRRNKFLNLNGNVFGKLILICTFGSILHPFLSKN